MVDLDLKFSVSIGGFLRDCILVFKGFPGGAEVKASACNARDLGSIPGLGRFPGEGNGNPLQYSCLENLMDREACSPQGRKELDTTEGLN